MTVQLTIGPQQILSTPQAFTTGWVDLGGELDTRGIGSIALWLNLDVNDGANMRVRALGKHVLDGTDEYNFPIETIGASVVSAEVRYVEFNVDGDQKIVLSWDLDHIVPAVQFQISAGTVGATDAQVDSAYVTMGY